MKYIAYFNNQKFEMIQIKKPNKFYEKLNISNTPKIFDPFKLTKEKLFGEKILLIKK